jgi:antitoxin PrlF
MVMQLHYHVLRTTYGEMGDAMARALKSAPIESTLTDRYQTTIPDTVRNVLGLKKRDKLRFTIQSNGQVVLARANPREDDPVLGHFLRFLARDIETNPQRIKAVGRDLADRVNSLVADVEVDLDAPLRGEDE